MTVIYYYCSFKHWLNTDTSLHGQFYLSLGKALTFSFKSNRLMWTPINVDIRHLFPAKSTDSHRKQTSLMRTIHHQLCAVNNLSFLKVKNLQLTASRCSQSYVVHWRERIIEVNFRLFWHHSIQRMILIE